MGFAAKIKGFMGYSDEDYYEDEYEPEDTAPEGGAGRDHGSPDMIHTVLVRPEQFSAAREISDHLLENNIVVLNLEYASKDVSRRLIDFLSGVAYAKNGRVDRIAQSTYIITPYFVDYLDGEFSQYEKERFF